MDKRAGLLGALSAVSMSVLLSAELHAPWSIPNIYSDIVSFWGRDWVQSGSLPYLHSYFEYPALSGLILYFARLFGPTTNSYYTAFSILSLLGGLVLGWSTWGVARLLGRHLNPVYFMMPSFLVYGVYNFDLFHAMFVMLSFFSYLSKRRGLSAVFLGLAVDMKLTSVVLLPVLLLDIKSPRELGKYLAIFLAALAVVNIPFALVNFSTFLQGYQYVGNYGLEDAWYVWIFQDPSTWTYAKIFGLAVGGLLLLRVYTLHVSLEAKMALAIAAYLLGTYIYAPQFNVLLLPLLAVLEVKHAGLFPWDALNALVILTWFYQPSNILGGLCANGTYLCPTMAGTWAQLFSFGRDVCLAWMCIGIASNEGSSLTGWVARRFGSRQEVLTSAM